jgi:hypothetical protein
MGLLLHQWIAEANRAEPANRAKEKKWASVDNSINDHIASLSVILSMPITIIRVVCVTHSIMHNPQPFPR